MSLNLIDILNNNQGVLSIIAILVAIITLIVMIKLSKFVADTTGQFINKQSIDSYMHKKLPYLMSLEKDGKEIEIDTLSDLIYYSENGYQPIKQYQMNSYTHSDSIIHFIQLVKMSKNGTYKPTNTNFLDIIKQLPVDFMLDVQDSGYEKNKRIPLHKYIKENNIKITRLVDGFKLEVSNEVGEVYMCHILKQLYRADFSGNKREEVLFWYFPRGTGSMRFTHLLGAYFGRKNWYSLRKKWHMLDVYGIKPDVYTNPFNDWKN